MLRPHENATRELKSLVGMWRFRADAAGAGRDQQWYAGPLAEAIDMPVPSSYNQITADPQLYRHVGEVCGRPLAAQAVDRSAGRHQAHALTTP